MTVSVDVPESWSDVATEFVRGIPDEWDELWITSSDMLKPGGTVIELRFIRDEQYAAVAFDMPLRQSPEDSLKFCLPEVRAAFDLGHAVPCGS